MDAIVDTYMEYENRYRKLHFHEKINKPDITVALDKGYIVLTIAE